MKKYCLFVECTNELRWMWNWLMNFLLHGNGSTSLCTWIMREADSYFQRYTTRCRASWGSVNHRGGRESWCRSRSDAGKTRSKTSQSWTNTQPKHYPEALGWSCEMEFQSHGRKYPLPQDRTRWPSGCPSAKCQFSSQARKDRARRHWPDHQGPDCLQHVSQVKQWARIYKPDFWVWGSPPRTSLRSLG